ncbi:MAG: response regulator transcription factor [Streptomyces sp.]|uniref:response regulator transcription factor n=1 Tax=Streptomyces sp. TaxID=1931 RepID=UPI0025FC134A|nr:response regulator transcription factor [Streptomyces sp.]MBW8792203.1 response regulator transcription factor [Streptomyces sp.]
MRVLVVEDDAKVRSLLRRGLEHEGFSVATAADAAEARWQVAESTVDAIVLDVLLPDADGFAVCEQLRAQGTWAPVLMLTALDDVRDRVRGLDVGADDYVVKPFALPELAARLRALLRRGAVPRPATLTVGDLTLDPASREVRRGGTLLKLTPREQALLELFLRHPDEVLSRTRIVEHVWDDQYDGDLHVVNVYVSYLRDKIDRPFGRSSLQTVRGAGYRLGDDRPAVALG